MLRVNGYISNIESYFDLIITYEKEMLYLSNFGVGTLFADGFSISITSITGMSFNLKNVSALIIVCIRLLNTSERLNNRSTDTATRA
jgi:hypothetical protein